jgi:hypothetical protein
VSDPLAQEAVTVPKDTSNATASVVGWCLGWPAVTARSARFAQFSKTGTATCDDLASLDNARPAFNRAHSPVSVSALVLRAPYGVKLGS